MSGCVYVATNSVNGRQYVGLTRLGVATRWAQHVTKSRNPKTYFHRAIAKYGSEAFVVAEYASAVSKEALSVLERDVILQLSPVYNQTCGGEVTFGRKYDDATKERMRASNTGKKRTAEQCARIAEAKKQQWASKSPEARALALAELEKWRNAPGARDKQRKAVGDAARGRQWSDASRSKLSMSCMGRKYGPDVIARMAASKRRPILCETTGVVYSCRVEAAEKCGVSPQSVFRVCNGKCPSAKGLVFSYVR